MLMEINIQNIYGSHMWYYSHNTQYHAFGHNNILVQIILTFSKWNPWRLLQ